MKKKVLITRSENNSKDFSNKLIEHNFDPIFFKTIEIIELDNLEISKTILNINEFDWIILTSVNTVKILFSKLKKLNIELKKEIKFAVIGEKVKKELNLYGFYENLIPETFISEALLEKFNNIALTNNKILIPCSEIGRDLLYEELAKKTKVVKLPIYNTIKPDNNEINTIIPFLKKDQLDFITFTSPSSIKNFVELLENYLDLKNYFNQTKAKVVCIGKTTKEEFLKQFKIEAFIPENYNIDGMIKLICNLN
ncbi:MAG: uroporphyrinogen-III synthase [Candidatus Sericytochromatia bacterium]